MIIVRYCLRLGKREFPDLSPLSLALRSMPVRPWDGHFVPSRGKK